MAANWVNKILALQELDMEIRSLKLRLTMIPKEKARIVAEVKRIEAEVAAARQARQQFEAELKRSESEVAGLNDKIDKLKQQSSLIKKNTEYHAMLDSVAMLNNAVSVEETRQLELMDKITAAGGAVRTAEQAATVAINGLKVEYNEFNDLNREVKARLATLEAQRNAQSTLGITEDLLSHYEVILGKNSGMPVVPVAEDKCGNCHLRLTPQTLTDMRGGKVTFCENCFYIVYDPEV